MATDVQFQHSVVQRTLGYITGMKMTRQHVVEVVPPHEEGKEKEVGESFSWDGGWQG